MQRIQSLCQHWSLEAKKSTLTNKLYQKHKFEMINGFKQFSTCHVQRETWCKEFQICTKNWPWVKIFSKCYNYGATAFFAQATPGGWGGVRNFFP